MKLDNHHSQHTSMVTEESPFETGLVSGGGQLDTEYQTHKYSTNHNYGKSLQHVDEEIKDPSPTKSPQKIYAIAHADKMKLTGPPINKLIEPILS